MISLCHGGTCTELGMRLRWNVSTSRRPCFREGIRSSEMTGTLSRLLAACWPSFTSSEGLYLFLGAVTLSGLRIREYRQTAATSVDSCVVGNLSILSSAVVGVTAVIAETVPMEGATSSLRFGRGDTVPAVTAARARIPASITENTYGGGSVRQRRQHACDDSQPYASPPPPPPPPPRDEEIGFVHRREISVTSMRAAPARVRFLLGRSNTSRTVSTPQHVEKRIVTVRHADDRAAARTQHEGGGDFGERASVSAKCAIVPSSSSGRSCFDIGQAPPSSIAARATPTHLVRESRAIGR